MSKSFVFEGQATIKRKFKVEVISNSYETAQEIAEVFLENTDDEHIYTLGQDDVEVEIDTYEEIYIPQF